MGGVWEALGRLLGALGGLLAVFWAFKIEALYGIEPRWTPKGLLGSLREGFGRVWGGFWSGFGGVFGKVRNDLYLFLFLKKFATICTFLVSRPCVRERFWKCFNIIGCTPLDSTGLHTSSL